MANNYTVKDGNGADLVLKSTDNSSVHTRHVNVDSSALPTGAATAANQTTGNGTLSTMSASLTSLISELQQLNGHAQTQTFTAIDTETSNPAMNGAAINATAVPTKKILIKHISLHVTGVGSTPIAANEVITVELLEETSGQILGRKQMTVQDVTAQGVLELSVSFPELVGVKLSTAAKRIQVKIYGHNGSYTPVDKDFTADLNIFYIEED